MTGYDVAASLPKRQNNSISQADIDTSNSEASSVGTQSPFDNDLPESPIATARKASLDSPAVDADSYFNSLKTLQPLSRTGSVTSLSRLSLSNQLSQLTSLVLPDASSLSTSISSIPTALAAASTLSNAADHMLAWLKKATEVLRGLDAEDDVEWAAAGGREGLGELDAAISKFEGLVGLYVAAIEDLQVREDIARVPSDQQTAVVDQMERVLTDWSQIKKSMKDIKRQVELAMEWEELWNTVLGDIGLELEALSVHVFEMEEARHKSMTLDPPTDSMAGLDLQELDTIMEEGSGETKAQSSRFSLPSNFQNSSPMSPVLSIPHDDTRLLALFARMQPLRASLDFLPMTLSGFRNKAKTVLPTACDELDERRRSLEKKWKQLELEAEGLREELGEDRWVVIFRNAGRQCQKLCDSVEKAIHKLQESLDAGTQHSNPPLLAKKVEAYEGKKAHYGPAIKKVLAIIEKGVTDRQTVNGEVLRLRDDSKTRWQVVEAQMKDADATLEDLTRHNDQQLRDSISSIVSRDRSATGSSALNTPGSSPASSVALGPASNSKREASPGINGQSRRSSVGRPATTSRRYFSTPSAPTVATQVPRKISAPHPSTSTVSSRNASPSPYAKSSATPTPGSRALRPSLSDNSKPRWNSSSKVDHIDFSHTPKHVPFSQLSSGRKTSLSRSPSSLGIHSSPLGRLSPAPSHNLPLRSAGAHSSLGVRRPSATPSTIAKDTAGLGDWVRVKDKTPPNSSHGPKKPRINLETTPSPQSSPAAAAVEGLDSPSTYPRSQSSQRPNTAMGNAATATPSRRFSMLPVPKSSPNNTPTSAPSSSPKPLTNGRASSLGARAAAVAASVVHGHGHAGRNATPPTTATTAATTATGVATGSKAGAKAGATNGQESRGAWR